jgi:hypothetical protein
MGCSKVQLPERWEMIYGDCLYPDKKDVEALKPVVSDHYKKQRAEYQRRLLQLREITKKEIQTLGKDKAHDYNWSERKTERKSISDLYVRICDDPNKRNQKEWKIPVDIAINENAGGLVEGYLKDSWASENGWSLNEIADHRQRYRNSLQTTAIHPMYRRVFLETFEASVRYIIKFQSGATYYLETVFIRELADKGEIEEFDVLTGKAKNLIRGLELRIDEKIQKHRKGHKKDFKKLLDKISPELNDVRYVEAKKRVPKKIPGFVVDFVFNNSYVGKYTTTDTLHKYIQSNKAKFCARRIASSRATAGRWLKEIRSVLEELGFTVSKGSDTFSFKTQDHYDDDAYHGDDKT